MLWYQTRPMGLQPGFAESKCSHRARHFHGFQGCGLEIPVRRWQDWDCLACRSDSWEHPHGCRTLRVRAHGKPPLQRFVSGSTSSLWSSSYSIWSFWCLCHILWARGLKEVALCAHQATERHLAQVTPHHTMAQAKLAHDKPPSKAFEAAVLYGWEVVAGQS